MGQEKTVLTQKKRGPAPTGKGSLIGVRLHRDLLEPLDEWIHCQPDPKPSRPEAIRKLLRASLIESAKQD